VPHLPSAQGRFVEALARHGRSHARVPRLAAARAAVHRPNGGPHFKFNEAVSFQVLCDTQAEIDHYWEKLSAGGDPKAQQCARLKDKFGVFWQVVPRGMAEMLKDSASAGAKRAMAAVLKMKKLEIAALQKAYAG
jgi:predicted 3-demethylubiquinone-9 3-methyltransferase (glyoxalase superfamily)